MLPLEAVKTTVAMTLMTLGLYRLWRHRHPRYGGMQVGFRDLTVWSFLMASAHGAGLMVLPFVMATPPVMAAGTHDHSAHMMGIQATAAAGWLAVAIHTLAYLVVMMLAASIVYRKFGLGLLRTAWLNLDWLWAGALFVAGFVVLLK